MKSLEELQEMGAISSSLRAVEASNVVELKKILSWSEEQQAEFKGAVVLDGMKWIATQSGAPVGVAVNVYSSDGESIGKWNGKNRSFYKMLLQGDTLVTQNIIRIKEEKAMAAIGNAGSNPFANVDVQGMGRAGSEQGVSRQVNQNGTERITGFDEPAKEDRIQRNMSSRGSDVRLPGPVLRNNYMKGRLIGFVTKTDSTTKLAMKSSKRMDNSGKPILKADLSAERRKQLAENDKLKPSIKDCEIEKEFVWKNEKPGAITGMILSIPVGTYVPVVNMGATENVKYDYDSKDLQVMILDFESGFALTGYNFDSTIKESEAVMGAAACDVELVVKESTRTKDGESKTVITRRMVPKDGARKTLLVEGNYFPMSTYKTASKADFKKYSKELNLNVEAHYAKEATQKLMSAGAKSMFKVDKDGTVLSSKWIDEGEVIAVTSYQSKDTALTDVRIALRTKTPKSGNSQGFKYEYQTIAYDAPEGSLNDPKYQAIIKATGLSVEEFKQKVAILSTIKNKKSGGGNSNHVSIGDYLNNVRMENEIYTQNSIQDLQRRVDKMFEAV